MKFQRTVGGTGPSTGIGIMRFFDSDVGGPKISPEFVVIVSAVIVMAIVLFQFLS